MTYNELKQVFMSEVEKPYEPDAVGRGLRAVLDALEGSVAEAVNSQAYRNHGSVPHEIARRWRNQFKEQSNG